MLYIASIIGMLLVASVLFFGLRNMAIGGSPSRSQNLMRLRILVQFAAVVVVMAILYIQS